MPGAAPYRLHVLARYGVPITNATGIACDGDHVWLVGGGHNAGTHTLAHVELQTSAVRKRFTFSNLIEQLGTGVYGITQLDGFVFISVAGNTNKIAKVDPALGTIVQEFSAPTQLGPSDLDVSEGRLVESSGTGDVFVLDSKTGAFLSQFEAAEHGRDHGIAVRGAEAFVGNLFGGMAVYNLATGTPLGEVTKADGARLGGRETSGQCVSMAPACSS